MNGLILDLGIRKIFLKENKVLPRISLSITLLGFSELLITVTATTGPYKAVLKLRIGISSKSSELIDDATLVISFFICVS